MAARTRGRPSTGDVDVFSTPQLLAVALDAFAERGYDGMSVRELARDLGVSHNLIPQRIGSKEQLWRAAVDHGFSQLTVALASVPVCPGGSDVDQLRAMIVRFIEANAARPALLRIISQEAVAPGPRFDYLFDNYIDPVRMFGAELLARLEAAGEIRTRSVGLLYFFMTHGAGGPLALPALAERFGEVVDPDDPAAIHDHATQAADLLFEGLLLRRR